jgi:Mn-dependent DtxR family transcriptional regulator
MAKPLSDDLLQRLIKVARSEPELSSHELGARFSISPATVWQKLSPLGLVKKAPPSRTAAARATRAANAAAQRVQPEPLELERWESEGGLPNPSRGAA